MKTCSYRLLFLLALLFAGAFSTVSTRAATLTVTSAADSGAGSLRATIAAAVAGDTIIFAPALNGQTILVATNLVINKDLTIRGPGTNQLSISGGDARRIFWVASNAQPCRVSIAGLSIVHGRPSRRPYDGGGIYNDHAFLSLSNCYVAHNRCLAPIDGGGIHNGGGGIYNGGGTMILDNTWVEFNTADSSYGGGIHNAGTLTLTNNSRVNYNETEDDYFSQTLSDPEKAFKGVGIYNTGLLTVDGSEVSGNNAPFGFPGRSGAIWNMGNLKLNNSVVSTNSHTGIYNDEGTLTVNQSSIAGNSGNGISNESMLVVENSTVSGNDEPWYSGGGIHNHSGGTLTVSNSQFIGNYGDGGGIANSGWLSVSHSQFIGNNSDEGSGILNRSSGTLTVSNSQFIGNCGVYGGGIANSGWLSVSHSHFNGNEVDEGGGILNDSDAKGATIDSCTFTGNLVNTGGGGIFNRSNVVAGRDIKVKSSTFNGNIATAPDGLTDGGGIFNSGLATVENTTFTENRADRQGGAIYNEPGSTMTMTNTTLSGNSARFGGGIQNQDSASMILLNSTLSGNSAEFGGGIFNIDGTVTVLNSTLSGNSASEGGGIDNYGTVTVQNSTLSGNSATNYGGGGIYNGGPLTLKNSIVAGNNAITGAGDDIRSSFDFPVSNGRNFIGTTSGIIYAYTLVDLTFASTATTLKGLLETSGGVPVLANHGGPTPTIALLPGSPAVNRGLNSDATTPFDQRGAGFPRIVGGTVDIGAFEAPSTGNLADMAVLGNGVAIAAGDNTPAPTNHTAFGIPPVDGTVVRTFTIQNTGTATLNLTGTPKVVVSGSHAADFSVTAQPASSVLTNGTTTFQVTFSPTAAGLRTATLSITNNDPNENPYDFAIQGTRADSEIHVTGNGAVILDGDTTPTLTNHTVFGVPPIGGTVVRTFTINNFGVIPLNLTGNPRVVVSGSNAMDFAVTTQPASSVPTNGTTTFQVTFSPTAAGLRRATLSIINNDPNENPYNFAIAGTRADPEINVTGRGVSITNGNTAFSGFNDTYFGAIALGSRTEVHTFTIRNVGNAPLNLTGVPIVAVSGLHTTDFTVTAQPVSPVPTNGLTTFQVAFNPKAVGFRDATLSITNNDPNENPYRFAIRGTGICGDLQLMVLNTNDSGPGSLRQALADVCAGGTINFSNSLNGRTIVLTNGELVIDKSVKIFGPGPGLLAISGNNTSRVFSVVSSVPAYYVTIAGLTLTQGNGMGALSGYGGAILNPEAIMTVSNCTISGSSASIAGGGIANFANRAPSTLTLLNTTLSGNTARNGGALGCLGLIGSTTQTVVNCTISGNSAIARGGAIYNFINGEVRHAGALTLRHSTLKGNFSSNDSGAIVCDGTNGATALLTIEHTLLAKGASGSNYSGSPGSMVVNNGYNLSDDNSAAAFASNAVNLLLGPLTNNGGSTLTHALMAGSPALDTGADGPIAGLGFDQRGAGYPRSVGGQVDIGAFETPLSGNLAEMAVRGNGVGIPDGDLAPGPADHTDFGSIVGSGGTVARTFTIHNFGNLPLNLTATPKVAVSGANAADFAVNSQPVSPVATNGTTTFQVTFTPSTVGLRTAILSINNNDPNENPYNFAVQGFRGDPEINVTGNGMNITNGTAVPSAGDFTDFGSVSVSNSTLVRTFTIQNPGSAPLNLTGTPKVAVTGANAADFTVTVPPVSPVAMAGFSTFQVTFDPSLLGLRTATLSIANDDSGENPYNFAIQGTGLSPEINVTGNGVTIPDGYYRVKPADPDLTGFGNSSGSNEPVVRIFTIQNLGNMPLNLTGPVKVVVSGPNAADFTVTVQPVSSVPANGASPFQVAFAARGVGPRSATLSIANDDPGENPYNFAISGTGVTPPSDINLTGNGVGIADGDTTPSGADHTDFGSPSSSTGAVIRTFTIRNLGGLPLNLTGIPKVAVSGASAADFTVTAQPVSPVPTNGFTTFQVTFRPGAAGLRAAILSITNDAPNENPYDFAIQGIRADPEINIMGNGMNIADGDTTPGAGDFTDFGSVSVSSGSVVRTFSIQNLGQRPLNLTGTPPVAVSGAQAADFAVTAPPVSPVATNGTTTFQITFNPSGSGLRTATLSITNDDFNESAYRVTIQGTGGEPEVNITGNNVSILDGDTTPGVADGTDFGSMTVASGTVVRSFTITNLGTVPLVLNGSPKVAVSGPNAVDFTVNTLPASPVAVNGASTFQVRFNPSLTGPRTATLSITNSDPTGSENVYTFAILGTGTGPCSPLITVLNTSDNGAGSVRQALMDICPGGTIDFAPALNGQTIQLTSGGLLVRSNVSILGPGAANLTIKGGGTRVFTINSGVTGLLAGLTIANGDGGLYNAGTLTVSNCAVSENFTFDDGGGIRNVGTLALLNSTISGNASEGDEGGGGLHNSGTVRIENSTISGNSAPGPGAGPTGRGGGLYNFSGSMTLRHSTVAGNSANFRGDGIYLRAGTLTVSHMLLSNQGENYATNGGSVSNGGFNLASDSSAVAFASNAGNLLLGPLANNGGPTLTHALSARSPAINVGTNAAIVGLNFDQRGSGFPRLSGSRVDIGAYESLSIAPTLTSCPASATFGVQNGTDTVVGSWVTPTATGEPSPVITCVPPSGAIFSVGTTLVSCTAVNDSGTNACSFTVTVCANNIMVTSTSDGPGSLREAISNACPGGVITFAPALNGRTIVLTNGELVIGKNLTILGPGPTNLAISGGGRSRVFSINPGVTNVIAGLSLTNGNGTGAGLSGTGGAILNRGFLLLSNSILSGNSAISGAGIYNNSSAGLHVGSSTVNGNSATLFGGGIYGGGGTITVQSSTVGGNTAGNRGGGIFNFSGTLTVQHSTLTGNRGVTNGAGGLYAISTEQITNCLVAGNLSGNGTTPSDISGTVESAANNLIGSTGLGATNGNIVLNNTVPIASILNTNLAFNGGPTRTHALFSGSPAINAGNNGASDGLNFNQRGTGFPRIVGGRVDIGAYEWCPTATTFEVTQAGDSGRGTFREAVDFANDCPSPRTITFAPSLNGRTVMLTNGELVIRTNLNILGPGPTHLTISGNGNSRVFSINPGVTSLLAGLTITGGNGAGALLNTVGGSILSYGAVLTVSNCFVSAQSNKQAVYNYATPAGGTLTVVNSRISDSGHGLVNTGPGRPVLVVRDTTIINNGKGIISSGQEAFLLVERCNVISNQAALYQFDSQGGGMDIRGGLTTIRSSTVLGNAARLGGGIYCYSEVPAGELRVENCTFSGNLAADGGGALYILADAAVGPVTIENSTFSGNSAQNSGGAIQNFAFFNTSEITLRHCTFSGNFAPVGGGIYNRVDFIGDAAVTLSHTLMAQGPTGGNYFSEGGSVINLGFNLADDTSAGEFATVADDLRLGPLADNGGPTYTHRLLLASPAIDAGAGTQPNAWQVSDVSGVSGSGVLACIKTLSAEQKSAATTNGWHYTVVSRLVSGSPDNRPAQYMIYGNGTRRFTVAWDTNASGQLIAGFNGTNFVAALTDPDQGTADYHTHELIYDPAATNATYRVDGAVIFTWRGVSPDANQNGIIQWGSGNSLGRGAMNYHRVQFVIQGVGVVAGYSAGTQGFPAVAPSPQSQGWTIVLPVVPGSVTNSPVSPDGVGRVPDFNLDYDQRGAGYFRNANLRMDIGAYEMQPPTPTQLGFTAQGVCVSLKGEPNEPLTVEWNSSASASGWQPLTTRTTDASGKVEVIDSAPLSERRFYRTKRP